MSLELLELLLVAGLLLDVELGLLELLDWLLLPLPAALALRILPLELDCVPLWDDDEELFDVMPGPGGELSGPGFSGEVDGYVPDGELG